jgi:predicted GNAT family acetyltransferase
LIRESEEARREVMEIGSTGQTTVRNVPERDRFEIELDGNVVGFLQYRRRPGAMAFLHTEIDPEHEGEGLGGILVSAALGEARRADLRVLPFCPFVRSYIERHPEHLDLVPAERRAGFGLSLDG